MAKTLNFSFEGKDYTLEYTRNSVQTMENTGFRADDLFSMPMTMLPRLFRGAFLAHHKNTKLKDIDRMFDSMTNRGELIAKLVEMYREPLTTITEDPEDNEGNVSWTASF